MASLQLQPPCCCDCPTKEQTGLPDAISASFSVLTSSGAGMPADEIIGDCDGNDIYLRFSHSAAIAELLSSIVFDYVESASSTSCGICCFRYTGRTDYTPACPVNADPAVLLGASPFSSLVYGAVYATVVHGSGSIDCSSQGFQDCFLRERHYQDGFESIPLNAFGSAGLLICVQDNVVTICLTIDITIECKTRTGERHWAYTATQIEEPCEYAEVIIFDNTTEACNTNTTSSIYLTATADLSAVSGANLWEKIKNADWESAFETLHCNCGTGGCVDQRLSTVSDDCCRLSPGCFESAGSYQTTEEFGAPVDRDCLYAIGGMGIAFND